MKKNFLFLIMISFFTFIPAAYAQNNKQKILDDLFKNKKEIYFSFQISERAEIQVLTKIISIENVKGNLVLAYANRKEFDHFLDLGLRL